MKESMQTVADLLPHFPYTPENLGTTCLSLLMLSRFSSSHPAASTSAEHAHGAWGHSAASLSAHVIPPLLEI